MQIKKKKCLSIEKRDFLKVSQLLLSLIVGKNRTKGKSFYRFLQSVSKILSILADDFAYKLSTKQNPAMNSFQVESSLFI